MHSPAGDSTETTNENVQNKNGSLLAAVNSKDNVESIKGRIIATSKLLKYLEHSEKDRETKIQSLHQQLKVVQEENANLRQRLSSAQNSQSSSTVATLATPILANKEAELKKHIHQLERELSTAKEHCGKAEELLAGREAYAKQLEAQCEDLSQKIKSLEQEAKKTTPTRIRETTLKDKITALEKQIEHLQEKQDTLEDDKMELGINYDMLQTAHSELKDDMAKLREQSVQTERQLKERSEEIYTLKHKMESKSRAQEQTLHSVEPELVQLRAEVRRLQQKLRRADSQDDQAVVAVTHSTGHAHSAAIEELRRYMAEVEQLKKEKRVLQDRYTEQLVINADMEKCQRLSSLSRVFPEYSPMESHESTARGLSRTPSIASISPRETHPMDTLSLGGRRSSSSATRPSPLFTTNMGENTFPTPPASAAKDFSQLNVYPPTTSPLPITQPGTSRPKSRLDQLERILKSPGLSAGRKRILANTHPSSPLPKQRRRLKKLQDTPTPPPIFNHIEFVKERIEEIAKLSPSETVTLLDDMEMFTAWKIDVLLGSLEAFLQNMRSHCRPFPKITGFVPQFQQHGVPELMSLECPTCIDTKEKNIAWMLWSLASLFPTEQPYPKYVAWAAQRAIEALKESKLHIACRLSRIFALICKKTKDTQRLGIFCYDIVRCSPKDANFIYILANVAVICPEVLSLKSPTLGVAGINIIKRSIQRIAVEACRGNTADHIKLMYTSLVSICEWTPLEKAQPLDGFVDELVTVLKKPDFSNLQTTNPDAFNDLRFNLIKSIELVLTRLDNWQLTYDKVILGVLWPLMNDGVLLDVCIELIGLLGRCGLAGDVKTKDRPGLNDLRSRLVEILELGNECPEDEFGLQVTAAKATILLSNQQRARLSPVVKWFAELKPEFRKQLSSGMQQMFTDLRKAFTGISLV